MKSLTKTSIFLTVACALFLSSCSNTQESNISSENFSSNASTEFTDVSPTKSYSKQQIQEALLTSSMFMDHSTKSPQLVSGEWAKKGRPSSHLENTLFPYITQELQETYTSALETMKKPFGSIESYNEAIFSLNQKIHYIQTYITSPFDNAYIVPEGCSSEKIEKCFTVFPECSPIAYVEKENGELETTQNAYMEITLERRNREKVIIRKNYTYILTLELRENPEPWEPTFIITGVESSMSETISKRKI